MTTDSERPVPPPSPARASASTPIPEPGYRAIIDASPVPMALNDAEQRVTFLNPAFVRTFGYSRADCPTLAEWWPLAYPDPAYRRAVADAWALELARAKRTGESFAPREVSVTCKDGSVRTVLASAALLADSLEGNHLVVLYDITARKQAEQALRTTKRLLEQTFEQSPVSMVLVGLPDGILESVNPATRRCLGTEDEPSLVGQRLSEVRSSWQSFDVHGNASDFGQSALARSLAGEKTEAEERRIVRKDGSVRYHLASAAPICDDAGRVIAGYLVMTDITDRKRAEEERAALRVQLEQAQRMESVGRLAGGVAHDFNNMLGVILGYADVALGQLASSHPIYDDLCEIRKAAQRSADLTQQLLTFARKQPIAPRPLDLNVAVVRMMKMLRRLLGENLRLDWRPGEGLWTVHADPSQIDQLLTNLCVNARDAIADVGHVRIETENRALDARACASHPGCAPGDYVRLTVRDDGCGMSERVLVRLFEPFFTTKEVGQGTGLGLATVHGIVEQNRGFIEVESVLGAGSTFSVHLPRHRAPPAETSRRSSAPSPASPGTRETILLVEDELAILKLTRRTLDKLGYVVLAAASPPEALALARAQSEQGGALHLLLTDVIMPEMNGRELAEAVQRLHPGVERLFMSGYNADVVAHDGVLEEGVNFLQKPFTPSGLAAKIREALDAARARAGRAASPR